MSRNEHTTPNLSTLLKGSLFNALEAATALLYWGVAIALAPIFLCIGISVLIINALSGGDNERRVKDKY